MRALLSVPSHTVTFLKVMGFIATVLIAPHLSRTSPLAEARHA